MLSKEKILRTITENRQKIKGYGVRRIGLFGSCLKGTLDEKSDIDLIVEFENKTFDNYMDLKFFLEDLFKRKVDLVFIDTLKPRLKPYILEEAEYATGL
mgnify:CR=1 FL=1